MERLGKWMGRLYGPLEISTVWVYSERLPQVFDGTKVVQISDLHNVCFGAGNRDLLRAIRDAAPDMIFFTGDILDSRDPDYAVVQELAEACVKIAPCYFTPGNHEFRLTYAKLRRLLQEAGVTVLDRGWAELSKGGQKIRIAGLADYTGQKLPRRQYVTQALNQIVSKTDFTLLLSHRPELVEYYTRSGVDAVFCGHAHGGEMRLPGIGGLFAPGQGFLPTYTEGVHVFGKTSMVVSRGLDTHKRLLRINNRPELVTAVLRRG